MRKDKNKILKSINKIANFTLFALDTFLIVKIFVPVGLGNSWIRSCDNLERMAQTYIRISDGDLQKAKEFLTDDGFLSPQRINQPHSIEKRTFEMNDEILVCVKLKKDFVKFGQEKTSIVYNLVTGEKDNQNIPQRVRADTLIEDIFTIRFLLIAVPLKKILILIYKNFLNK